MVHQQTHARASDFLYLTGATVPLTYELAAEVSWDEGVSEGVSASLYALAYNVVSMIWLFLAPGLPANAGNVMLCITSGMCLVCYSLARERYSRLDVEEGASRMRTSSTTN